MLASILSASWNALLFALRNPQVIVGGWAAAWVWLLYTAFQTQGTVGAIQLASTGLLNLGSIIGLPIPLVLTAYMLARQLSSLFIRAILSIFKRVQAESLKAAKKAGAAVAKAVKSVRRLKAATASSPDFLGAGGSLSSEEDRYVFLQALDELSDALGDPDLALYLET